MKLSPKFIDFLTSDGKVEFLEGTTKAGKTTVAFGTKFIYKIKKSTKTKHLIAGESIGTIESNIINNDHGLLDLYGDEIEYNPRGKGKVRLPHLKMGEHIIYLVGYDNISRFKKVLGGQFGVVGIDEINIAVMSFIEELFLPRFEYLFGTLNPDDPNKEIYSKFINRSRPIAQYEKLVPKEIMEELKKSDPQNGWLYWFFTYKDNPTVTEDDEKELLSSLLPDSVQYKRKIQGLRAKATGLIFNLPRKNIISIDEAKQMKFAKLVCGVDTAYSQESEDTFAFIYAGITDKFEYVVLDEQVYNNRDLKEPLTPSDIPEKLFAFIERNNEIWGNCRTIFIDNADAGTILECQKVKKTKGLLYKIIPSYKKTTIINRLKLQNGWLAQGKYLIVSHCKEHIAEHNRYSWLEGKDEPEDRNDHTINASQYAWLPYKEKIGKGK